MCTLSLRSCNVFAWSRVHTRFARAMFSVPLVMYDSLVAPAEALKALLKPMNRPLYHSFRAPLEVLGQSGHTLYVADPADSDDRYMMCSLCDSQRLYRSLPLLTKHRKRCPYWRAIAEAREHLLSLDRGELLAKLESVESDETIPQLVDRLIEQLTNEPRDVCAGEQKWTVRSSGQCEPAAHRNAQLGAQCEPATPWNAQPTTRCESVTQLTAQPSTQFDLATHWNGQSGTQYELAAYCNAQPGTQWNSQRSTQWNAQPGAQCEPNIQWNAQLSTQRNPQCEPATQWNTQRTQRIAEQNIQGEPITQWTEQPDTQRNAQWTVHHPLSDVPPLPEHAELIFVQARKLFKSILGMASNVVKNTTGKTTGVQTAACSAPCAAVQTVMSQTRQACVGTVRCHFKQATVQVATTSKHMGAQHLTPALCDANVQTADFYLKPIDACAKAQEIDGKPIETCKKAQKVSVKLKNSRVNARKVWEKPHDSCLKVPKVCAKPKNACVKVPKVCVNPKNSRVTPPAVTKIRKNSPTPYHTKRPRVQQLINKPQTRIRRSPRLALNRRRSLFLGSVPYICKP